MKLLWVVLALVNLLFATIRAASGEWGAAFDDLTTACLFGYIAMLTHERDEAVAWRTRVLAAFAAPDRKRAA